MSELLMTTYAMFVCAKGPTTVPNKLIIMSNKGNILFYIWKIELKNMPHYYRDYISVKKRHERIWQGQG